MIKLDSLNPVQKQAVLNTDGPVMILAGAGSGKTKTLVTRISYLLEEKNVSAHQLLALTFSNKAAREMRERIAHEVSMDVGALQITTFHAFCAKLLRSEANYLGLSRNFTIYDEGESKAIAKSLLERRGISTKEINPYDILTYIDSLKNNGYYPGRVMQDGGGAEPSDEFFGYFEEYESELHRANALDFGGLITAVIQLFEKFPDVLSRYQNRFVYVLVDEYQDTNRAQFELIKMLCGKRRNICVVGDEDQSIYSWRGADIRNILDFEKVWPDVKVLKLEQNYRSSKTIIEAASCVIEKNTMRKGKHMWTDNPEGDAIEIVECFNDKDEAEFIANESAKLYRAGVPYKEMAVFYRSNAQARQIEDALRKSKINYRVVGGVKFYERKEIKDMLSYLRLIINSKDSLALSRIINVPARGVGATSLRKLEVEAVNSNTSLWDIIEKIVDHAGEFAHIKLSAKIKSSLSEFVTLINELRVLDQNKVKPSTIYEKALHESGYYAFLKANKDYETLARLENLDELLNAITQFEDSAEVPTLSGFLETITLDSNTEFDEGARAVDGEISLMTVHGAKGLEFTHAFVVGAEENVFPSYRSVDSGEIAMEEERRLFYVAMTRAMIKLYITFAQGRMLFGQVKFNGPSRFIDEIPEKLYSWKKLKGHQEDRYDNSFSGGNYDPYDQSQESYYDSDEVVYQVKETAAQPPKTYHQPKFPKGSKVVHSLYGAGLVESSEGAGAEEKVQIKFTDGNRKKFMVKFAPIVLA
ncbi:ATP-dependent DNA helicase PcrA [Bacteriovorax stolpii]|uniref:DNA 3'-5' helicase n=1 Tax=Bacteriovorax stolpii TaxID=960 RepID=A0A2K9NNR4_BACTC|nr:UvrD-helicase domain-containing protein [Bacteriovorax stolpii]AUN96715.1 ATP-dependent DNA helicase PcrA [Bacteriovorax stolpii]QDK43354.1 ATP-dependent DNA helicase PcrA [Bacteriovorax stolpii]TDP53764.1 DNA helicase-2/ATP-dependent DNA helicase PcrA [Bacteriovorax stolpii]